VDHAIPDLQINLDAGGTRLVGKHHGVVQYRLAVAYLDQERRQVPQISI